MQQWVNWSGSLSFSPGHYWEPQHEDELCGIVRRTCAAGKKIRLAAAGHSSSPLVQTPDTLIHLRHFKKLLKYDVQQQTATFQSGISVHEANAALQAVGLALFNTGDVDVQTLAGAIATGTHGSGRTLQNMASVLCAARVVNSCGDVSVYSDDLHPDILRALRVSLGTLGFFTEITVRVMPLFKLRRHELFTDTDVCLEHFDQLSAENRNVDFYWYPRSDESKVRILNEPGQGAQSFAFQHHCVKKEEGWVGEILPRKRDLKFDEMEYALPAANGLACFQAVRERIKKRHRKDVAWRVLVRNIAKDDNYISPHHGRDSISISLHHNAGLPFEQFFNDVEPIFIEYGGRPHWAKIHSLTARQLRPLYAEWNAFHRVRKALDPDDFFINDYLRKLLFTDGAR